MGAITNDLLAATILLVIVLASLEIGFRLGRRAAGLEDSGGVGQIGAIQGALLGLLGLLLAFSFSGAASRFLERQDLIVEEANAIGTAYLRADFLDEPHRTELRSALRRYTEHRIELSSKLAGQDITDLLDEVPPHHDAIWAAARRGVESRPATMVVVLPPVNEVIDLHSVRIAAGRKHLPILVVGLLIAASALAIGAIGYGCGLGRKRRAPLSITLALLIGMSLWITIDLDHAREGLLRISDAPLKSLRFDDGAE